MQPLHDAVTTRIGNVEYIELSALKKQIILACIKAGKGEVICLKVLQL
jgi:hypothetical protein